MADSAYDHCPREQQVRVAASILVEAEDNLRRELEGLLLSLHEPSVTDENIAQTVSWYHGWTNVEGGATKELARRAARAALAVLLAGDGVALPEHVEIAYDVPKTPVRRLIDLARRAKIEIEHEAEQRKHGGNAEPFEPIERLCNELGAAIDEAAA